MVCPWRYEHPRSFYMGVPPGTSFIFFLPNSSFSKVSAPLSHVVKTWAYPDLRGKIWPKNFHDHLRGQIEWQLMALFIDKALSCAVSQGNREGGKSHALSNKPTIYRQGFHFASTPVYVSGFITAVQMIRNVFSEQVFYSTSAARCFYRPDTSWHSKEMTTAMWSEIGVKLEAWNLIQNTAVICYKWRTLSRNQSFKLVVY